jgi:hypothetical protein
MEDTLLEDLIENGFDFLEKAIQQFKTEPKYSVINFCAAIELLLKARLMSEHWSLLIATKNHPDINNFRSGNFKSINFNDLIPRITSVTGEKIPTETTSCFRKLASHRNKMIHFFHEAHGKEGKNKLLEEIAIEQCNGWFFLRRLLEKWNGIFGSYTDRIHSINNSMKAHELYLQTVFDRVKPEIEKDKLKGIIFTNCKRCQHNALEEFKKTPNISEYKCRVCFFSEGLTIINCTTKECRNEIKIEGGDPDGAAICHACNSTIEHSDIAKLLEKNSRSYEDYYPINCANCSGMDTVVENEKGYFICTNCFYFTQNDIGQCGWCHEVQMGGGNLEFSGWSGCEFCDGQAGHMKDD